MKRFIDLLTVMLIVLIPVMTYIRPMGLLFNISMADPLLVVLALIMLVQIKKTLAGKKLFYVLYFVLMAASLCASHFIAQNNEALEVVGLSTLISELIKLGTVGGYFYLAYLLVKDAKDMKLALYSIALGGIPIMLIGFGAYLAFQKGEPFAFEDFSIKGNGRLLGTFEDPNLYAFYLIMVFYISLLSAKIAERIWLRTVFYITATASVISIVFTMSRGGWVAFAVSAVIFILWGIPRMKKEHLLVGFLVGIILFSVVSMDYYLQDGETVNSVIERIDNAMINGDEQDRFQLSAAAVEMGNEHFLFGVGKGNFPLNSYMYLESGKDNINYIAQYISHNTVAGTYAQQGILGAAIFLSLFIWIAYLLLFKHKSWLNGYTMPLLCGWVVQSMTIQAENIRFLWFFAGLLLAAAEASLEFEHRSITKMNRPAFAAAAAVLGIVFAFTYFQLGRMLCLPTTLYRGNTKTYSFDIEQPGDYELDFDIQTDGDIHAMEVWTGGGCIARHEFRAAYGNVKIPVTLEGQSEMKFISGEDGWMKVQDAFLVNENGKIPVYNYPLLPRQIQTAANERGLLRYAEDGLYEFPIKIAEDGNTFNPIEVTEARIIKHSNLSTEIQFDLLCKEKMDKNYQFDLMLAFDSLSDLSAYDTQTNVHGAFFGLWPNTSEWEVGQTYTVGTARFLSAEKFQLYGRFFESESQTVTQEGFFPMTPVITLKNRDSIPFGTSNWINLFHGMDEAGQFVIGGGGLESGTYDLEPGKYAVTFQAKGSFLEEFSKAAVRTGEMETIEEFYLNGEMTEYTVIYETNEPVENMSFTFELINPKYEQDVGNRNVYLLPTLRVEKAE